MLLLWVCSQFLGLSDRGKGLTMAKIKIKKVARLIVWCPPFGGERLQVRCEGCPFYKGIDTQKMEIECNHRKAKGK